MVVSSSFHQHSQTHYQVSQTAAAGRDGWAWSPIDLVTSALKPHPPLIGSAYVAAAVVEVVPVAVVIWRRLLVLSAV